MAFAADSVDAELTAALAVVRSGALLDVSGGATNRGVVATDVRFHRMIDVVPSVLG